MTCAEFQNVLPYIIDSAPSSSTRSSLARTSDTEGEYSHLDSCRVCSDVVADLKHIAQSAKVLVGLEEPSERVWHNIRRKLEHRHILFRS